MIYLSELYASELLGGPVIDRFEDKIGRVEDIVIEPQDQFPKVTGLVLRSSGGRHKKVLLLPEINLIGRKFISTRAGIKETPFAELREGSVLVKRDLMDKQIVDIHGSKVVRVNDLKIAKIGEEVRLIAADVGVKGVLRRLKLEQLASLLLSFFNIKMKEDLIGWNYVEPLQTDLARIKLVVPYKGMSELHPSDIASIISQVHTDEKTAIFESLTTDTAAEALHELEPRIQAFLIGVLDTKKALAILEKMPSDEAADVLGDLPEEKTEEFLQLMKKKKAQEIQELLKHDDETAGGLMTTDVVTLEPGNTVAKTIEKLRELAPGAETIYYLYVTDEGGHLLGVLTLRGLIISKEDALVGDIMNTKIITVRPEMNRRQVADVISKYNLLAVPVVDKLNRILGIITVDDVVDYIIPPLARKKRLSVG